MVVAMSTVEFDPPRHGRFDRGGERKPVAVLGGGPAGLTAGYLLARKGVPVIVFEAEDQVGGIAKTEVRDGFRFERVEAHVALLPPAAQERRGALSRTLGCAHA